MTIADLRKYLKVEIRKTAIRRVAKPSELASEYAVRLQYENGKLDMLNEILRRIGD